MQISAMTSVAGTAWRAVKPHIPMIKFRRGGLVDLVRGVPQAAAASPGGDAAPAQKQMVLEEWQVPLKYRRERISEEEIEYINRGGPA